MNVGLIMKEAGGGFADVYFTRSLRRARCLDPHIDEDLLLAIGREIENRFRNIAEQPTLLSELIDRYSNVIQLSSVRQCLAADPAKEMKTLIATLVETSSASSTGEKVERKAGRRWLRTRMAEEFWTQGLKGFVQEDLPAAPYTNEADDFTIDFSYMHRDELKCFQAVSLIDVGLETRMFPLRVAKIKSEAPKIRREKPRFTAVVEDHFDREDNNVKMILAFMNAEGIRIEPVGEMPNVARQARVELGV